MLAGLVLLIDVYKIYWKNKLSKGMSNIYWNSSCRQNRRSQNFIPSILKNIYPGQFLNFWDLNFETSCHLKMRGLGAKEYLVFLLF